MCVHIRFNLFSIWDLQKSRAQHKVFLFVCFLYCKGRTRMKENILGSILYIWDMCNNYLYNHWLYFYLHFKIHFIYFTICFCAYFYGWQRLEGRELRKWGEGHMVYKSFFHSMKYLHIYSSKDKNDPHLKYHNITIWLSTTRDISCWNVNLARGKSSHKKK